MIFGEDTRSQIGFFLLQSEDFFFNAASDDQFVDKHFFGLAKTMRTVGGLIFNGRVPPRIIVDDSISGSQIQPGTAGFQADQEDRHFTFLEAANRRFAVGRAAGQRDEVDLLLVQLGGNQIKHRRKLREKQNTPAFYNHLGQHIHQQIELGAFLDLFGSVNLDQTRVTADLTQLQQRIEDNDLAARKALGGDFLAHTGVHRATHRLVKVALRAFNLDAAHDDGFFRQLLGHLIFFTPQHEGLDAAGEQRTAQGVALLLDWRAPGAGEVLGRTEKAGHQEIKQRPQLAKVVFQRRSGQAQTMLGAELAHRNRCLAGRILDRLRLVKNQQVIGMRAQRLLVAPEQGVSGQANVVFRD